MFGAGALTSTRAFTVLRPRSTTRLRDHNWQQLLVCLHKVCVAAEPMLLPCPHTAVCYSQLLSSRSHGHSLAPGVLPSSGSG